MLTTIIIIAVVLAVALWAAKTSKQPEAPKFETKEEIVGYETGSIAPAPVVEAKPKKKTAKKAAKKKDA